MNDLKPGRELDALVAEKVMGWDLGGHNGKSNYGPNGDRWACEENKMEGVPYYSTDIAAAWELVEKLDLSVIKMNHEWMSGEVSFCYHECSDVYFEAKSESAPHAICLSALAKCEVIEWCHARNTYVMCPTNAPAHPAP